MNRIAYWFYTSNLWTRMLRMRGRVPAGGYVGPRCWMDKNQVRLCVGEGWVKLVDACFDACLETGTHIDQVKEKFGGLRFYVGSCPEWVQRIIDTAENASYETCEVCGKPGEPRPGGWVTTRCDLHAIKLGKRKGRNA